MHPLSWIKPFICRCLTLLFVFTLSFEAKSQIDDKFWFVAPDVTEGGYQLDYPILLRLTSAGQAATVTIQKPADLSFSTITVNLAAYQTKTVDLTSFLTSIENAPPNKVLNNGIYIESTTPIVCYYELASLLDPDIFALKGKNALGTDFLIPSQNTWKNGWGSGNYNPPAYSSFEIVATEDNTSVVINNAAAIVGHGANQTFTINLNKGQTYSATCASAAANQQPGGSTVTSDKPIAVTVKHDCLYSPSLCADLAGDQIVPLNSIGKEYVVTKGFLSTEQEYAFVWAPKATSVTVYTNGSTTTTNVAAKGVLPVKITNQRYYITANNPVYLVHFSGFGCELGMALMPSVCSGSNEVTLTRTSNDNFGLIIMTRTVNKGAFKLNGVTTYIDSTKFDTVPGTAGKWSSARIVIDSNSLPKGNTAKIENTNGLFHVGMMNGGVATGCRYGYFSNFVLTGVLSHPAPITVDLCGTGSLSVKMSDTLLSYTYQWYHNNIPISGANSPSLVLTSVKEQDSGDYKCLVADGCFEIMSNPARVSVKNKPATNLQMVICTGDSVFLQGQYRKVAGSYTDTFKTSQNCDSMVNTNLTINSDIAVNKNITICQGDSIFLEKQYRKTAGTYTDTIITSGCDTILTINLQFAPHLSETKDTILCQGDSILINGKYYSATGTYHDTINSSGSCNTVITYNLEKVTTSIVLNSSTICSTDSIFFKNKYLKSSGVYMDTVFKNTCIDTIKQLDLFVKTPPLNMLEVRICPGDSAAYQGNYYHTDTFFYDTIPLPPLCDSVVIFHIREVGDAPQLDTGYYCEDSTAFLDPGIYSSYLWNDGSTNRFFTSGTEGKYWVRVTDTNNCILSDTFFVFERCDPFFHIPSSFTPNNDGLNDYFYITTSNTVTEIDFIIFDRWGEIIFKTNNKNFRWNGVYKDKPLPTGVYHWQITVFGTSRSGKIIKLNDRGMISIIR